MASSLSTPPSILPESSQMEYISKHSFEKRNRAQLSCTHCRQAKLKCDRQAPCSQCIKKGRASQCTFPSPQPRKRPAASMQSRLRHLEDLVKDAMNAQTPSSLDISIGNQTMSSEQKCSRFDDQQMVESSQREEPPESSGSVVHGMKETAYVGATHWAAILDDIEEVKSYFDDQLGVEPAINDSFSPDVRLLFNSHPPATKQELLDLLPERAIIDKLVNQYFISNSPSTNVLHRLNFQSEYVRFYTDVSATPLSWLAMLYGMMSIAVLGALSTGERIIYGCENPMDMIHFYRRCCAQSLILSNYTQPGQYTIEAMMIYMEGEFVLSTFDQVNCYLIVGVMIRLAMRLGLHRDASKVGGNISACQGELRRRVWHTLIQIDCLASFHIGLPSMGHGIESDTEYPSNLRDEDFDESTAVLPTGRPESERTPVLYMICKGRLIEIFGKVASQANRLTLPAYAEVQHLDNLVNEAFSKLPSFFRIVPLELAITDPPELLIVRFNLALLYQKIRCVLHRKYLMKERENPEFAYSKTVGLEAATELLHYQSQINSAVQPGGRLSRDKWFLSSISMHDFLLAATIVYLNVMQIVTASVNINDETRRMIEALNKSYSIWLSAVHDATESKKAAEVLGLMLGKIRRALGEPLGNVATGYEDTETKLLSGLLLSHLHSNAMIPPMTQSVGVLKPIDFASTISDFITPPSDFGVAFDPDEPSVSDFFGNMIDVPSNFDWDIFDSHLRRPQPMADDLWPDLSFGNRLEYGDGYDV